jgi:hypothetical protein
VTWEGPLSVSEVRPAGRPFGNQRRSGQYNEIRFLVSRDMYGEFAQLIRANNTTASVEMRKMLARWIEDKQNGNEAPTSYFPMKKLAAE